jgi:putative membrane protein
MLGVVALHIIPAVLFALVHGAMRYSVRGIAVFFAICLGVGGAVEIIGVRTNTPFGSYYFTDVMGPKFLGVPLLLALAYVGMGYLSWTLANVILSAGTVNALRETSKVAAPLVASFIMVAWDFSMDPVWSTILHAWVWRDGGPYFGVPISNFVG